MKKIPILFSFLLAVLFLGASVALAKPYSINFDADASGTTWSPYRTWGWHTDGTGEETISGIETVDIITHQQLGADDILNNGDTFYETFTLRFFYGLDASGNFNGDSYVGFGHDANLYVDITLMGIIDGYDSGSDGVDTTATNLSGIYDDFYFSYFTSGTATMYIDNNDNQDYDGGTDTQVATFAFHHASPYFAQGSVFASGGTASEIDFGFTTTSYNSAYIQQHPDEPNLDDLIANGWLLTLSQTSVAGIAGEIAGNTTPDPDEILLGFDITGADIKLQAIPEPTTVLLFGSGLLGLGGFFRRKKS